jgi:exosortase
VGLIATAVEGPAARSKFSWPLIVGFAALAVPTLIRFAQQNWGEESGAAAPIVLATGGWLLWRNWPSMVREGRQGGGWITIIAIGLAIPLYVFGRAFSFALFEAIGLYVVGLALLDEAFGLQTMLRQWFPLLYLGFAVPLPSWVLDSVTAPLKEFVSFVATTLLQTAGYPVARQGVTITIAQYQLLVEDACSGLNSLFGLVAIGLLYAYLTRASSPWRFAALTFFIVPIAVLANILRVIIVVLLTYYAGNEVGQSFVHYLAGFVLFGLSLMLVFAVDQMIWSLVPGKGARAATS